ncbi:Mrp/NBP35 family ATP-binding protein [Tepidanaerobacter acetatoxydans]|uniref:Mrp/NBP35 family ATP-binding protein n=1 Tax=Tepidanaerobacter acetatoxydans TaxID=499229 RepID=UPI0002DF026A|nr:Mrp/NBP35 family ATP-binding protein [Tepidanaerobacter acetatoxydans]
MKQQEGNESNKEQTIKKEPQEASAAGLNRIKKVIAVMSGKGGVGKSTVTGLLAVSLKKQGYSVGIMDADITGPSIPRMFGINKRPENLEFGLMPAESSTGIRIMSLNLLLENEDDPVIWRGPLIGNAIQQFWNDVVWGDLDYLLVDLPPGTSDAPLTVMQSLPVDGLIVVSSPQELVGMVVKKAVKMANMMDIRVIGLIENYSYMVCPKCKEKIEVFGKSRGEEGAKEANVPYLGSLPIDYKLAKFCDEGRIEEYESTIFTDSRF